MFRILGMTLIACLLVGCREEEEANTEPAIRGLKVFEVSEIERSQTRRFPGVLEPADLTVLSFEIGGRIGAFDLDVGQRIKAGQIVAQLEPETFQIDVETSQAAVDQAAANTENAKATLERQEALLTRGSTTKVAVDDARTQAETAAAALVQAQKQLESAREMLGKADLVAPVDAIVSSVDATPFATLSAGAPVASVYSPDDFEVSFSVNFDAASQLVVGKPAMLRLADRPDISLAAVVSEMGARADSVSSFPVVLQLQQTHPLLKAGMAVEAAIEFPLPFDQGYPVPLASLIKDGREGGPGDANTPGRAGVFVFDAGTSSVQRREVQVGGIRENMVVVVDGLSPGDLVAAAGVSFLKEGQKVRPLAGRD